MSNYVKIDSVVRSVYNINTFKTTVLIYRGLRNVCLSFENLLPHKNCSKKFLLEYDIFVEWIEYVNDWKKKMNFKTGGSDELST